MRCQPCLQNSVLGAGGVLEIRLLLDTSTWVLGQAFLHLVTDLSVGSAPPAATPKKRP